MEIKKEALAMNFCWCTITTGNLVESMKFYTEVVGLSLSTRFSPRPGMEIVFLVDEKGNEIELISFGDDAEVVEKKGISIGFEVSSLEDTLALVASKGVAVAEQPVISPVVKYFFVKDPNGVTIQFVEKPKSSV